MPSDPATTGANGKVSFDDISLGYYEIEEAQSPTGYAFLDEADKFFYVKVDAEGVKLLEKIVSDDGISFREVERDAEGKIRLGNVTLTLDISDNTVIFEVENTSAAALPMTGGPGAELVTLAGAILAVAAAAMILLRRPRLAHASAQHARRAGRKGGLR